jgi:hypothetical protein
MTRTMYDSTTTTDIPDDAELVAYYPKTYPGDVSQFKKARIVTIDNQGDQPTFGVLDVESGAASVADAPKWLDEKLSAGDGHGTLYCNKSTLGPLLKAIGGRQVYLWIADPTGAAHEYDAGLPSNVKLVATQYAWPELGSPGHYDMSLVTDDDWYKATPAVVADPPPPVTRHGILIQIDEAGSLTSEVVQSSDGKSWEGVAS